MTRAGLALLLAVGCGATPAVPSSPPALASPPPPGGPVSTPSLYSFAQRPRAEIVAEAARRITATFGVDLADYPQVSVRRTSRALLVTFTTNMMPELPLGANRSLTPTIELHATAVREEIQPASAASLPVITPEMRAFAKDFAATDSLVFRDTATHLVVQVSRRGGGAEQYSIDKQTKARRMDWHEHPPHADDAGPDLVDAPLSDAWVEVP